MKKQSARGYPSSGNKNANYKHSKSFELLKHQREALLDNYSSSQYIEVWDELLYKAIEPIFLYTNYANELLSEIFHHTINNFKRKISTVSKEHLVYGLFLFHTVSRDQRIDVYKQMRLERTITKYIIKTFLNSLENYQPLLKDRLVNNNLKSRELEDYVKLVKSKDSKPLLTIKQEVDFYNKEASSFKTKIMEKHTRNIIMEAQRHYKFCNLKVDLDTIVQTMYQFASYAVDKYDSANGTLTSYISNWLQHARGHAMSQELTVDSSSKDKSYVHLESLDDYYEELSNESDDNQIETQLEVSRVRVLAKMVDPTGLGRLSLDIQETLNKEELSLLLQEAEKLKNKGNSKTVK